MPQPGKADAEHFPTSECLHSLPKSHRPSLRSDLSSDHIRSVSLSTCLLGWGQYFGTQGKDAMFKIQKENYGLSRPTNNIDNFLSHDWATNRFWKFVSLIWMFNAHAAVAVTLVFSCGLGALRATIEGAYSSHFWPVLFCYATFVVVLVYWQWFPCGKDRRVFLDRLCIAQHDVDLKALGISGLASFLRHSTELTVLWSEHWITRLWCVYELATFLSDGRTKPLRLIPVKLSSFLLLHWLAWTLLTLFWNTLNVVQGSPAAERALSLGMFALFGAVILPSFCYLGTKIVQELERLPASMQQFRIQDVQCYCCSHDHRHPESGKTISCDRELVYSKLKGWFASKEAHCDDSSYLEHFNTLVQEELPSAVLQNVASVPFSYAFCVAGAANFPWLSDFIPWWVHSDLEGSVWFLWFLRGFMSWSSGSLVMTAMVPIQMSVTCFSLRLTRRARTCLAIAFQVPMLILIASLLWYPCLFVFFMTEDTDLAIVLPWSALIGLNAYLFWPRQPRAHARLDQQCDCDAATEQRDVAGSHSEDRSRRSDEESKDVKSDKGEDGEVLVEVKL